MSEMFFNARRVYQATALGEQMRADGLRLHERVVLERLAAHIAFKDNPATNTVIDTCFPTVETLVSETWLSDSSIYRALRNLVKHGYLTTTKMSARKFTKKKSMWENTRYHVTPRWDSVGELWDKKDTTATPHQQKDLDISTAPPVSPPVATETAPDYSRVPQIIELIQEEFPDHPTFTDPAADRMMTACIRRCIDQIGSGDACHAVISEVLNSDSTEGIRTAMAASKRLGGWIEKSLDGWWQEYLKSYVDQVERCLPYLLSAPPPDEKIASLKLHHKEVQDVEGGVFLFRKALAATAGANLLSISVVSEEDKTHIIPTFSEKFRADHLKTHAADGEAGEDEQADPEEEHEEQDQECLAF